MIIQLPTDIIAKIAAGEVITGPYNIIKETIENSIDANAHNIIITISNDNLNLEIKDDGEGIEKQNFNLLCQRHCTSKFDGLNNINNFGFRGEALSSISMVSKIKVISRKKENEFGYKATYNGNDIENIRLKATDIGTTIYIEDIFYNHTIRRRYFYKRKNETHSIFYLITNYAIYYSHINFKFYIGQEMKECFNDNKEFYDFDIYKRNENIVNKKAMIKRIYKINGDLLEIVDPKFLALISHVNYGFPRYTFILFINGRLVQNDILKDRVKHIYKSFLPKGRYPFVYFELYVEKDQIDVNVHPSKKEVLFYGEEKIFDYCINKIVDEIKTKSNTMQILSKKVDGQFKEQDDESNKDDTFVSRYKENRILYTDPNSSNLFEHIKNDKITLNDTKKIYRLKSIKTLKDSLQIIDDDFFKHLVYIGEFNENTLIQNAHMLMMFNIDKILDHYFYQRMLYNLGCFDTIQTNIDVSITLDEKHIHFIKEYFNIIIIDGVINQIPIIDKIFIDDQINDFIKKFGAYELMDEIKSFDFALKELTKVFTHKYVKNEQSFNMLKRNIMINETVKSEFKVVTSLQELYKLFDRC